MKSGDKIIYRAGGPQLNYGRVVHLTEKCVLLRDGQGHITVEQKDRVSIIETIDWDESIGGYAPTVQVEVARTPVDAPQAVIDLANISLDKEPTEEEPKVKPSKRTAIKRK